MPEGDTIHKAAARLRAVIEGRVVTAFESPRKIALERAGSDLVGRTVSRVEARGKYLLVHFDDGRTLETHMLMNGVWRTLAPGRAWPRNGKIVAVVATEGGTGVCSGAPHCELRRRPSRGLARLGPDLLDPDADLAEATLRIRRHPELPIGVALMRQDLVAGIGNVYKSEVLYVGKTDPFAPVAAVDDEQLGELLAIARRQMQRNLTTRRRGTRRRQGPHNLHVYDRSGEPCYTCGTLIAMRRQGAPARSTYFCEECQGVRFPAADPDAIP